MDAADVKDLVRAEYGGIASGAGASAPSCCGVKSAPDADAQSARMGYSADELSAVPQGANLGLGCGNPHAIAALQPGETVVDLGSGAGFDCLLAARQVGPEGRVIGVDMTHEMLAKARANAVKMGAGTVSFRLGEIEHLPVADGTADVVISNCVVNLAPNKKQVFREAFRVLRRGGRVAISDVVSIKALPADMAGDAGLLCACVAGAVTPDAVIAMLADAGFHAVRVTVKPESRALIESWAPGRKVADYVVSAFIEGRKPQ